MHSTTAYSQTEEYKNSCTELNNLRGIMQIIDLYQFFYMFAIFISGLYLLFLPVALTSSSKKYGEYYLLLYLCVYPLYKILSWPMRIWQNKKTSCREQAISRINEMAKKASPWVARCHGYSFKYELPKQPGEK